jgi:hypothetical protein
MKLADIPAGINYTRILRLHHKRLRTLGKNQKRILISILFTNTMNFQDCDILL